MRYITQCIDSQSGSHQQNYWRCCLHLQEQDTMDFLEQRNPSDIKNRAIPLISQGSWRSELRFHLWLKGLWVHNERDRDRDREKRHGTFLGASGFLKTTVSKNHQHHRLRRRVTSQGESYSLLELISMLKLQASLFVERFPILSLKLLIVTPLIYEYCSHTQKRS